MSSDLTNQFLRQVAAVKPAPSPDSSPTRTTGGGVGGGRRGLNTARSTNSGINAAAQSEAARVREIIANASPSQPLTAANESAVLRRVLDGIAVHSLRLGAPPLGGGNLQKGGAGGGPFTDDIDSLSHSPMGSPRRPDSASFEDTIPFGPASTNAANGGGVAVGPASVAAGAFAGHVPQPLPSNAFTAAGATASAEGPFASGLSRQQIAAALGGATPRPADVAAVASSDAAGAAHETEFAAFFEAHRLFYCDENGALPDLRGAATIVNARGAAAGNDDGATEASAEDTSVPSSPSSPTLRTAAGGGGLSAADAANAAEALAKGAASVTELAVRVQQLSATTMPPADAAEEATNGPRSATPFPVRARGPAPALPPAAYPFSMPESVYGPYFEPLAWAAAGQVVIGGGVAGGPSAGGPSASAAHRRLQAAAAAAAAQQKQQRGEGGEQPIATLAEACEVLRVATLHLPAVPPTAPSASSTASGLGQRGSPLSSSSPDGPPPPSVAAINAMSGRNWAYEWRSLLAMDDASLRHAACRGALMDQLAAEFAYFAGPIAQTLAEEARLPPASPARTHRPLSAQFSHVFIAKGLIFVACDTPARRALYGSAEAAARAAANELRAQRVVRGSPHLNSKVFSPLCCTVTALGRRYFVSAPMPLRSPQDVVYGSVPSVTSSPSSSPSSVQQHFTTTNFAAVAAYELGELFGLSTHKAPMLSATAGLQRAVAAVTGVSDQQPAGPAERAGSASAAPASPTTTTSPSAAGASSASTKAEVSLPADAKLVYSAADGATWLLDAARLAPPAATAYAASRLALKDDTTGKSLSRHPSENSYNAHLSVLFRPEFLRTHAVGSTNADAALRCQPRSERDHIGFMINALLTVNVPAAAAELVALEARGELPQSALTAVLHRNGVNARYMGKIYQILEHGAGLSAAAAAASASSAAPASGHSPAHGQAAKPHEVRAAVRAKLALEMAARTFKALVARRLTQEGPLFNSAQLLDRLGWAHTTAAQRMAANASTSGGGGMARAAAADEEGGIVIDMVQQLLLCRDGAREGFWEAEMKPLMEQKFGVFVCPAIVAAAPSDGEGSAADHFSAGGAMGGGDGANLKVYRAMGVSGKRRVEKPKPTVHWTELPGGRSVVDDETTLMVQTVRTNAILFPLLGPNAHENAQLLARAEQLGRFEIGTDHKGKRLACRFGHKASPCTALLFSPAVAAMARAAPLAGCTAVAAVLAMDADPTELRAAVESAARSEVRTFQRLSESGDARAVLPLVLLAKALAHRGLVCPASVINKILDVRKLVPTDLVNAYSHFRAGELFMLCRRYDRAETAFAAGLERARHFASLAVASQQQQQQVDGTDSPLGHTTTTVAGGAAAPAPAVSEVTAAMAATPAPAGASPSSAPRGSVQPLSAASVAATTSGTSQQSSAQPSSSLQQRPANPISDLHPAGLVDLLALACRSLARIVFASGRRPPADRARLVLSYYHYAIFVAESCHHARLLPALLLEAAVFRRQWATLPRESGGGNGADDGEGTNYELGGTAGSRATRRTAGGASRATPGGRRHGGGGAHGQSGHHSSHVAMAAAAERNRRATSLMLAEEDAADEDNDTFVRRFCEPLSAILLPRDAAVLRRANNGGLGGVSSLLLTSGGGSSSASSSSLFPSALLCDVTAPEDFVSQLSLFQGLGVAALFGAAVTISPPGTAGGVGGGTVASAASLQQQLNATNGTAVTAQQSMLLGATTGGATVTPSLAGGGGTQSGSPLGPTIVVRGATEARDRKPTAPLTAYNASVAAPPASADPLMNALAAVSLSPAAATPAAQRAVPQEVRPLLWRAFQLMAALATPGNVSSPSASQQSGAGSSSPRHLNSNTATTAATGASAASSSAVPMVRAAAAVPPPASSAYMGEAMLEVGVLDGDAGRAEAGAEAIARLCGPHSRAALRAEVRLADVLFESARTVCRFTQVEGCDPNVLARAERQLRASLAKIVVAPQSEPSSGGGGGGGHSGVPPVPSTAAFGLAPPDAPLCTLRYAYELHAIIGRLGRIVDAYSRLPCAKQEDAARRYLADALPPAIGAAHPLLADVYSALRAHYMHLGEAREEAVARSSAVATAAEYALQWLECATYAPDGTTSGPTAAPSVVAPADDATASATIAAAATDGAPAVALPSSSATNAMYTFTDARTIAQHLRMYCEKIVKPLRSGGAHERAAAWRFYLRCGALLHDAPPALGLEKDARVAEAMAAIDGAFKTQHRVVVQSEKKALLQRQVTAYAREMHLAARRVRRHKNRGDHYCEIQLRTIETAAAAVRALMAGVTDDDVLLWAQDALEYRDEVLKVENQLLQRRNQNPYADDEEGEGEGEGEGEDGGVNGGAEGSPTNATAEGDKGGAVDGKKGAAKKRRGGGGGATAEGKETREGARPMAKAYVSPYACLSSPDDSAAHTSQAVARLFDRRPSAATGGGGGASEFGSLQRTRSTLQQQQQMAAGPPPSSPGGFLPQLLLPNDASTQAVGRLLNRTNQSMVAKNHNPVRNM